jgi:ABC-type multidrug transport system ATPase subunit
MKISVKNLGKRFGREWIFRNVDWEFANSEPCAILGANGSGKSTFLQILAGILPKTEGNIVFSSNLEKVIEKENIFKNLAWVAPTIELIEEFTLQEFLVWHHQLKPFQFDPKEVAEKLTLSNHLHKFLKNFSSGMKQRVKLATALYGKNSIIILDEPTTNLDAKGIAWYQQEITKQLTSRLVIIASNQEYEYEFCQKKLNLIDFK